MAIAMDGLFLTSRPPAIAPRLSSEIWRAQKIPLKNLHCQTLLRNYIDTWIRVVFPVSIYRHIHPKFLNEIQSPFPNTWIQSDARQCWAHKDCPAMRHGRFGHPRNSGGRWTSRPGRFWPLILINLKPVTLRICRESASDRSLCEMESQVWDLDIHKKGSHHEISRRIHCNLRLGRDLLTCIQQKNAATVKACLEQQVPKDWKGE